MNTPNRKKKCNAALSYQKMGISIIPVGADKKPFIEWKEFQKRCTTEEEIRRWWEKWPDANPAMVTGKVSGIVALDLDLKHGRTSNEFLIPPTASARSGSGGEHFFFKYPNFHIESKAALFGPGVDIRGDGGYILLAPSTNAMGGLYEWIIPLEDTIADIPEWLRNKLSTQSHTSKQLGLANGVSEGSRNNSAASCAGELLYYFPESKWEDTAWSYLEAWNERNKPPLGKNELRNTFESVKKMEKERRVQNFKEVEVDGVKFFQEKTMLWGELNTLEFPENRWRIKNLIPKDGATILAAVSGEGKTWVALELARSIAAGRNFLGEEQFATTQGKVLYLDAENAISEIQRRGRQLELTEIDQLIFLPIDTLNLSSENVVRGLLEYIKNKHVEVIIVDTFRAVAGGLKEEKAEEVRQFFNRFKLLKGNGVSVIWLDHYRKPSNFEGKLPKKEFLFGSQDKTASIEVLLMMKKEGDEISMYQRKNRLGKEIEPFKMHLKDEDTGNGTIKTILTFEGELDGKESKKNDAKEHILEILNVDPKTTPEIKEIVYKNRKIGQRNVQEALKELLAEGLIDRRKQGRRDEYFLVREMKNPDEGVDSIDGIFDAF